MSSPCEICGAVGTGRCWMPSCPHLAEGAPGYWMFEQGEELRPAMRTLINTEEPLTPEQIAVIRTYLRQWINARWQPSHELELLRATVGKLQSRRNIGSWLEIATRIGLDPL